MNSIAKWCWLCTPAALHMPRSAFAITAICAVEGISFTTLPTSYFVLAVYFARLRFPVDPGVMNVLSAARDVMEMLAVPYMHVPAVCSAARVRCTRRRVNCFNYQAHAAHALFCLEII